jgi:hypothetical protein
LPPLTKRSSLERAVGVDASIWRKLTFPSVSPFTAPDEDN